MFRGKLVNPSIDSQTIDRSVTLVKTLPGLIKVDFCFGSCTILYPTASGNAIIDNRRKLYLYIVKITVYKKVLFLKMFTRSGDHKSCEAGDQFTHTTRYSRLLLTHNRFRARAVSVNYTYNI